MRRTLTLQSHHDSILGQFAIKPMADFRLTQLALITEDQPSFHTFHIQKEEDEESMEPSQQNPSQNKIELITSQSPLNLVDTKLP